jgi:hypothetical protein
MVFLGENIIVIFYKNRLSGGLDSLFFFIHLIGIAAAERRVVENPCHDKNA